MWFFSVGVSSSGFFVVWSLVGVEGFVVEHFFCFLSGDAFQYHASSAVGVDHAEDVCASHGVGVDFSQDDTVFCHEW